jgi:hypothetical protein
MKKKIIAGNVIELLKKGYSPKEVTERMAVSYNYAWKLKKDLEKAAKELFTPEEVGVSDEAFIEAALAASQGKGKPKPGEFVQADTNVDAILDERAYTYGSFRDVAEVAQEIKATIRIGDTNRSEELPADQIEALDMIASKIARILCGDSDYVDSWIDIAGYATLVADRLQGKIR